MELMPKTVDYSAMNSLSVATTAAETCLVCLSTMEYDFAGMCLLQMEVIAVHATDSYVSVVFAVLSTAFADHSECVALIHCLLPPEPIKEIDEMKMLQKSHRKDTREICKSKNTYQ